MKISAKIISGYAALISVMAAVLTYQVLVIHRMQSIHRELSNINFRAGLNSLQLMRYLDLVDEYARKSFAWAGDPDFRSKLKEFQAEFVKTMRETRGVLRTEREIAEADRLLRFWGEFSRSLDVELNSLSGEGPFDLSNALDDQLERMKAQAHTVHQAILQEIERQVSASALAGQRAEWISWSTGATALVLSILVSLLIVRSITEPLKQLTLGTRAIAKGKFFYRLDTSRNDEFSHVARDFNTMTLRLGELDQMKKDFVSHVSHELKAPLASMHEATQLMLEAIPGPITEKQRRLLELNLEGGKRLSSMIGNLLDLSRMEAGVMEYELLRQDLAPLVRTVAAELETRTREKLLKIEVDLPADPIEVVCDGARMIQVLGNLTGNALKFSPEGGAISIGMHRCQEIPPRVPPYWRQKLLEGQNAEGFVLVTVADMGPGIPDDHKERVFEKFHQVKQGQKVPGQSAGLGLAICRTIIEAHRGAIWVEDNPPGGSRFALLLRAGGESGTHRYSSPI